MVERTMPKEGSRRGRGGPFEKAGSVIKTFRQQLKWTQEDLAAAYGSTQGYISSIERGWQPITTASAEWYERMAEALKIDVQELMRALEVDFVIARDPNSSAPEPIEGVSENLSIANLDTIRYVRFITNAVQIGGTGDDALTDNVEFFIPLTLAQQRSPYLRIGIVGRSHVDAVPNNVKVLFDVELTPDEGSTVVFTVGKDWYLGYYSEPDKCIVTDRPISDNHARRLPLASVHFEGVVESYQPVRRPSRPKN